MKKKIIAFFSVFTLLVAMLSGCNKVPTAEELVLKSISTVLESADMDVLMTIEMSSTGETTDMSLVMDINVKTDKEVSYSQGEISLAMLGMEVSNATEVWNDLVNNMSYTYNSMYDCWISAETAEVEVNTEAAAEVGIDMFDELTMVEVADGDTEYVVTTTMNLGDAYALVGTNMGDTLESVAGLDLDSMNMDVTLKFDRETEMLTTIIMSADEVALASLSESGAICTVLEVQVTYNEVNGELNLEIPATVLEEAVSADVMLEMLQSVY